MEKTKSFDSIRWTARITGTLMVIFVMLFAIGSLFEGLSKPAPAAYNTYTIILFLIWGAGLAGLILAWWNERVGGLVSLCCFIIFNILAGTNPTPGSGYSIVLLLFMIPSILYLLYWWLKRDSSNNTI